METSIRSFFERFRSKPELESSDPAVRAAAVLRIPGEEHALLASFARDADPRVRRAATKKLQDPALLGELARDDSDTGVREEAAEALLAIALHAKDAALGAAALAGLKEARHLSAVVRGAQLEPTRRAALDRIADPRALAAVAREAPDASLRQEAVARIQEAAALTSLAQNSEHKAVALAAVEKLRDRTALQVVAGRAKVGAAARRAKLRLEEWTDDTPQETAPLEPSLASPGEAAELEAYETQLAALKAEENARHRAEAEREALCERLEAAPPERADELLAEAQGAWQALVPLAGSEAESLDRRFAAAADACRRRQQAWLAAQAARTRLLAICDEAEAIAVDEDDPRVERAAFAAIQKQWAEATKGMEVPTDLGSRFASAARRQTEREALERAAREQREKAGLARLTLLAERLERLAGAPGLTLRDAERGVRDAKEALDSPGIGPARRDRDSLLARIEAGRKLLYPRLLELRADTEWKRWANVGVQEELCERAEALRSESDPDKAARAIRDLDARWKAAAEVDKARGESLWLRFKTARDEARARCEAHYATKAREQAENVEKKQALCARAEALQDSTDWLKTADELKKLQAEWKSVGAVPHPVSAALWDRFRKACDHFFTRREADLKSRKQAWARNDASKVALCEQAEALAESNDWEAAASEIKKLQADWKAVGPVKKARSELLWQRFRAACDRFFERYKRRDEITRALDVAAREALCASLEALLPPAGGEAAAPADLSARLTEAQTTWRLSGGVPLDRSALDERFRRAIFDLVAAFPGSFRGTDLDPEITRKRMQKLCARVEALAPAETASGAGLAEQLKNALAANTIAGKGESEARRRASADEVKAAREAWRRLSPLPAADASTLLARFEAACKRALA